MLFNVNTGVSGQPGESFLISGSSWSSCVSYFEGLGKKLVSIVDSDEILILNNIQSVSFLVSLKDDITNTNYRYVVYDSFSNVINWADSQADKSVVSISKSNRQFVAI